METKHSFNTLVVITPKDFQRLISLYPRLADAIDYGQILFVADPEIEKIIDGSNLKGREIGRASCRERV